MKLNLCCSDGHLPTVQGWVNVDRVPPADEIVDLDGPWPWPESSADEIRAHDAIEHLPDKIHTMNEAWRVLTPGGRFDIKVPTTDGRGAFQDPQHCSLWNRNSFYYYTVGVGEWLRFRHAYGIIAAFRVVSDDEVRYNNGVIDLKIVLEAIK